MKEEGEVEKEILIDEEMEVERGNKKELMERVMFEIDMEKKLKEEEIEIVDEKI